MAQLLSAKQARRLRTEVDGLLTESYAAYSRAFASDGAGGRTITESTREAGNCRVIMLSAYERAQAGAKPEEVLVKILLPYTSAVEGTDRIAVGSESYEVTGIIGSAQGATRIVTATRL